MYNASSAPAQRSSNTSSTIRPTWTGSGTPPQHETDVTGAVRLNLPPAFQPNHPDQDGVRPRFENARARQRVTGEVLGVVDSDERSTAKVVDSYENPSASTSK